MRSARLVPFLLLTLLARMDSQGGPRSSHMDLLSDMLLADAWVHGDEATASGTAERGRLSVLIATELGRTTAVGARVRAAGGAVKFEDDRVGYLRVDVARSQWTTLRGWPEVLAAQIDGTLFLAAWTDAPLPSLQPRPQAAGSGSHTDAERKNTAPRVNVKPDLPWNLARQYPYNLDNLLGVTSLRQQCPTCDGRGVTIAFVEGGAAHIPVDHPAFASALTSDGSRTSKFVDIIDIDPGEGRTRLTTRVTSSELRVDRGVERYILPKPGTFDLGEVQLDGRVYAVAWDLATDTVWLDTNQDHDFRNEDGLRDARIERRLARFEPNDSWKRQHFFVLLDKTERTVTISPVSGWHAAMDVSIAAGADEPANFAKGMAPAARALLVSPGPFAHGYFEALITAARHPQVDIISVSKTASRNTPNDSALFAGLIVDRLVEQYDKPVVHAAGNLGSTELVDPAGLRALSVGAYADAGAVAALLGEQIQDGVWPYSARGPVLSGAVKPDVVAPPERVAAGMCLEQQANLPTMRLPRCYMPGDGTSAAAPHVAGALALLLSAARQTGVQVSAQRLSDALRYTARFIDSSPAHEQGNGLIQVDAAWKYLREKPRPSLSGRGSLAHALVPYRRDGTVGMSLYEREGWRLGETGERSLDLTDLEATSSKRTYTVSWSGNDGTFSSPSRLFIGAGKTARLPIRVTARTPGIHSALLTVKDSTDGAVVHRQLATIVVPFEFDRRQHWRLEWNDVPAHRGRRDFAIRVPKGGQALRFRFKVSGRPFVHLYEPAGWQYHRSNVASLTFPQASDAVQEFVLPDPIPGTWYLSVIDTDAETATQASLALEWLPRSDAPEDAVASPGSSASRPPAVQRTSTLPTPAAGRAASAIPTVQTTQSEGCHETVQEGWLASSTLQVGQAAEPVVSAIAVKPGTETLQIDVSGSAATTTHVYLYDCTQGVCTRFDVAAPAAREQSIRLEAPTPGEWRVAVTPGPDIPLPAPFSLDLAWTCADGERSACASAINGFGAPARVTLMGMQCASTASRSPSGRDGRQTSRLVPSGRIVPSGTRE